MADEISEALLTMEANEPHANLYGYAEEYVSDLTYELMGIGDDEDFNELVELVKQAVIHGAQWQKQQFEKNRLKHCNSITNEQAELEQGFIDQHLNKYQRMPTFLDAIEYGMRLQREQMMKDAFIFEDKHNTACILASECLRNHGWFNRERDFNNLWRFISGVNKLFEGEFKTGDKVKLIIIKED